MALSPRMPQPPWAKPLNRLVGDRIQHLRRSRTPKPLTQRQLSERTRATLTRSSIASIERGLQGISLAQLYALAQALEVEPAELLPTRAEVLPTQMRKVEELLKESTPQVASFLRQVQHGPSGKQKGGADA